MLSQTKQYSPATVSGRAKDFAVRDHCFRQQNQKKSCIQVVHINHQAGDGSQQTEWLAGYAGELHPRVIEAFGLAARTSALELDMSAVLAAAERSGPVQAPVLSSYPLAAQDVALIVDAAVPAADVEAALRAGAASAGDGALLEDVRLFDVYTGEQVGEGRKSLAYALRFRAPDRTLTAAEVAEVRAAAVAEAGERVGAELRG